MMTDLNWIADDEIYGDGRPCVIAKSGKVEVGNIVNPIGSGRWMWEICVLPDTSSRHVDRSGWEGTEAEAKKAVQDLWSRWCEKAGLTSREG